MAESSFDIVSEINHSELSNAVDQSRREVSTRFDFKNSDSEIDLQKNEIILTSDDEGRLAQLIDILHTKMIKRGLSLKSITYKETEKAGGMKVKKRGTLVAGIEQEEAKKINNAIKSSGLKVKTQIMDQKIRVTGKSRDELQKVIQVLRENKEINIPLQFNNYK